MNTITDKGIVNMNIDFMPKDEFAQKFIDSVEEFYSEWSELNNEAKLPDFDKALQRAKDEGLVSINR